MFIIIVLPTNFTIIVIKTTANDYSKECSLETNFIFLAKKAFLNFKREVNFIINQITCSKDIINLTIFGFKDLHNLDYFTIIIMAANTIIHYLLNFRDLLKIKIVNFIFYYKLDYIIITYFKKGSLYK